MICERCKEDVHFLQADPFCNRAVCHNCTKASKNPQKTKRVIICKDCWGNLKKRSQYKSM